MSWNVAQRNGVTVITMRTNQVNAQNRAFFADLHAALDDADADRPGPPLILTGTGDVFSAGLDFDEAFAMFGNGHADDIGSWLAEFHEANLRLFSLPRLTVAAVNGPAIAGGVVIALACDRRVAVPAARFVLNEVAIGIPMPAALVEVLRYAIGDRVAAEMLITSRAVDAEEALDLGLVHRIVEPFALVDAAVAEAVPIGPDVTVAWARTKRALQAPSIERMRGAAADLDQRFGDVVTSDASRRALARQYKRVRGRLPDWAPQR